MPNWKKLIASGSDASLNSLNVKGAITANQFSGNFQGSIANNLISANQLNVTGNGTTSQYLRSDGDGTFTWATPPNTTYSVGNGGLTEINFTSALNTKLAGIDAGANNYSLPEATATTRGGIELFSNTDNPTAANAVSSTAGRTYGIQLNSAGQAVVNVPWSDTNTNTTYTAGSGLTLVGTEFRNSSPDQTVTLTGAGATTISGTYPNFTISSTDTNTNTNYFLNGITKSGNTLTFSVSGTTNQTYTFGSNAFTSYSNHVGLYDTIGSAEAVNVRIEEEVLPAIPTNNNQLTNGAGYITSYVNTTYGAGTGLTLSGTTFSVTSNGIGATQLNVSGNGTTAQYLRSDGDGTFTWATPPNTTYSVGNGGLTEINFTSALNTKLAGIATGATNVTNNNQLTNGAGYQTAAQVSTAIQTVVDSAPAALDTLNELAAALGDDANFAGTMTTALAGKLSTTGKAADSNLLDGLDLATGRNNVANQVVRTNSSGYAEFGWINTTSGNTTGTITDFYVNTNDGYIRKATNAHVKSQLGLGSAAYVNTSVFDAAGSADAVNTRIEEEVLPAIPTNNNQLTNGAGYITSYVNTTYTAGTGLTLVGTQFRNTAPDQTVTLTGAGATTISGTYPNFTITSTDTNTDTNTVTSIRRDNTGTYRTGNINLVGGSNVTITETSAGVFSFSSTDTNTNTTYSAGTGLNLSGTTFSHADTSTLSGTYGSTTDGTKVDSITVDSNGHITAITTGATGDVQGVTAGNGLTGGGTSGTVTLNVGAGTGISVAADTVSLSHLGLQTLTDPNADRVLGWDDSAGTLAWFTLNSNITTSGTNINSTNTNTTYSAGSGITLSGTTFSNAAPDQTVTLTGAGATTISGTYPNFTITSTDTNTDTNTTYSAGTGLTLTGTTFSLTNTYDNYVKWQAGDNITYGNIESGDKLTFIGKGATEVVYDSELQAFYITSTDTNTDTNTTYSAGSGITLSGTTFSHSDTSTQSSVNNSGRTYIQDITLDGYGHITGITSATETVVNTDTNTTYSAGTGLTLSGTTFSVTSNGIGAAQLNVSGNGNTSQYLRSDGDGTFTWATPPDTNTNTTYSAGTGLTLTGTTFSLTNTYDNYQSWSAGADGVYGEVTSGQKLTFEGKGATTVAYEPGLNTIYITSTDTNTDTNTTYTADGNYGLTLSGTTFRLEDDRRRNSTGVDIYSGNTHDFTWYDADVGIRWYTAGAEEMRLQNDGTLHVDGDVVAYSTTVPSDERLKDNVTTIQNPLDKIKALRGVEYDWNNGNRKGKHDLGLIAQEVEAVIPEIVYEHTLPMMDDSDTLYKTVDYEKMVAVLIEGMKEQQTQIESLKSEIETIKGKL